jgi:phage tail-like protein
MPDTSPPSGAAWPLPRFVFEVKWDDTVMRFQEVSGLDAEAQPIENRHGGSPQFSVVRMPGIRKYSDVTMKKGVFKGDQRSFLDWFGQIRMNTIQRKSVTISLLDEDGRPAMVWTLVNAWPNKITGTEPNATGDEVAVESIVFSHEGLTVKNA